MKRINIPAILFCLILAAGCSQDEPATENPDNGNATGKQITVTAAMPDTRVDTRLAYEDETNDAGTGKLVVRWKESGEKISLFNATQGTSSILTQNATSLSTDGKKTDFTGNLPDNTVEGDVLYAYYYNGFDDDYFISYIEMLNIADITSNGTLAKIKHAMYAKTTYQGGQEGETDISFSFRPLTAALKLTLEGIPSDVTINKLKLSGPDLFYNIEVNPTQEPPSYSYGLLMERKEIEYLSLSSTNNVFYTGLIPGTLPRGILITATGSDGKGYIASLPAIEIEAGNVYVAKVTLAKSSTITTQELKDALRGTNANPIVIDGDLIYDYDSMISLGADHTLTINSGATLTLNNAGFFCEDYTLTINGGGKLIAATLNADALMGGNVKLENVTIELLRWMSSGVEVGNGAVIVVDAENSQYPIRISATKKLTVKEGGKIEINNFINCGIECAGTLHIDGGAITINGLGSTLGNFEADGWAPHAILINYAAKLEISNGGTLTSTVPNGTVYLGNRGGILTACTVTGAKGLFQAGDYTLDTDEEVQVGTIGNDLEFGAYKWSTSTKRFVWTSRY